jgi:Zn-dependent protease
MQFFDVNNMWPRILMLFALVPVVMFHELGHAIVALKLGDTTAKDMGRITLNPIKHMDFVGTLLLLVVGFGWAKPVMVNPHNLRIGPRLGFALVAIAGPLVNFVLAFIMAVAVGVAAHFLGVGHFLVQYFIDVTYITVLLGVFNLIPVPPLDGSKILGLLLPGTLYDQFVYNRWIGMIFVMFLVFTGVFANIISPILAVIMDTTLVPIMTFVMRLLGG